MMNPYAYFREVELLEIAECAAFAKDQQKLLAWPRYVREMLPSGCILFRMTPRVIFLGNVQRQGA
jgi:hypothetical protein